MRDEFDLMGCLTINIKHDLYAYYTRGGCGELKKFLCEHDIANIGVKKLARPPFFFTSLNSSSLTNFKDQYLFLIVGDTMHHYTIYKNEWASDVLKLNIARDNHSSCSLGDYIYVFGGYNFERQWIDSLEYLNATSMLGK